MADAQGWQAIDTQLQTIYGKQEPKHWGTVQRYSEGGPDPLDGISAYAVDGPPHWHYVTFGFSELYQKTSKNPAESGWGFELTLRLPRDGGAAPEWPLPFLQNLARYVFNTGNVFDDEHYITWGGPITRLETTTLEAVVFSYDPSLGTITTPNGTVKFLRVIGITSDEHTFAASQGPDQLLARVLDQNPFGLVHLMRLSSVRAA